MDARVSSWMLLTCTNNSSRIDVQGPPRTYCDDHVSSAVFSNRGFLSGHQVFLIPSAYSTNAGLFLTAS
jgi:hypothetical protein